jgi:glycine oxidase
MSNIIVIGGGVIGLSIAYELANRRHQVTLIERDRLGQKSSWAGAGIITPSNAATAIHPLEKLEAISTELHIDWSQRLLRETGIDNEFQRCGGLYLARTRGEQAAIAGLRHDWHERRIAYENWDPQRCKSRVPNLSIESLQEALFVPDEFQLRNPRHLQALAAACRMLGVQILEGEEQIKLVVGDGARVMEVQLGNRVLKADYYSIACGAWSAEIFKPFEIRLPVTPVRGQVALFCLAKPLDAPIINEGTRYLVPRRDGHVIAGATIEEVGFDSRTVAEDIAQLVHWAQSLIPDCNQQRLVKSWAGLRPGSYDGFPYLGWVTESSNALVAAGHFKAGLHLSTGTAVAIADLIEGGLLIDLSPFAVNRAMTLQSNRR